MRRARSWVITCGSPAKQHHRHGDHGQPVVVALVAGCFLVWVGMAVGALDFLGVVDAD